MKKNTPTKLIQISSYVAILIVGVIIGLIWNDLPYVSFNGEIDAGSIISFFSLLAAIFIIPFTINTYFARRSHIGSMLKADIDDAILRCDEVSKQFCDIHLGNKPLTANERKLLMMHFRDITNIFTTISQNSGGIPEFKSFKEDVLSLFTETAYVDFTESSTEGKKISYDTYQKATKSMRVITSKLRTYRYLVVV